MPKSDPFRDAKLSEQVLPTPGLDQRLFAPSARPQSTPPPPPANGDAPAPPVVEPAATEQPAEQPKTDAAVPRKVDTYKPRNLGTKEPRKVGPTEPRPGPARPTPPAAGPRFDFDLRPGHQANFLFTDEELDALEDVKRDARRKHGLTTTKQDIVRYAVIDLLEDFEANGEDSRLIRWLKQRPYRR